MAERKIRILVAKPGLDGHDRGAKVIAQAFRDAGFEVIYTGLRQTPEMIVATAEQEDIDCIAMSMLSGSHMTLMPKVTRLLREKKMDDILVIVGGVIPSEDIPLLKQEGIAEVFRPGSVTTSFVEFVKNNIKR
jgi:methylmalonyl-CoA mutase, C-terminal domain